MKYMRTYFWLAVLCFWLGLTGVAHAVEVPVFFADKRGVLVEEIKTLPDGNDLKMVGMQLLHGPQIPELYSTIPKNTGLRNIWIEDRVVYVDFSKELFSYGGGTFREQTMLAQIVATFTQNKDLESVQILIEGEKMLAPEGSPTDQPLKRVEVLADIQRRDGE